MKAYFVIFDKVVKKKLEKAAKNSAYKKILTRWFDQLELEGPTTGKLLDNKVWLYEMKSKRPPLRLYFHYQKTARKIILLDLEIKKGKNKQQKTIKGVIKRIIRGLHLFLSTLLFLNFQEHLKDVDRV